MSHVVRHEQCPKCAALGKDRHHDNLGVYSDGAVYCYSCGYSTAGSFRLIQLNSLIALQNNTQEKPNDGAKAVLPRDFTREIPATYWQWLLQYGLPMSYWKTYCGYSEKDKRLIITYGNPTILSVGRAVLDKGRSLPAEGSKFVGGNKWKLYGNRTERCEPIGEPLSESIVLVEDIVSAHKIAQVSLSLPLFGTDVFDEAIRCLKRTRKPVVLWLDADQYQHLPKKINRIQSLTGLPVSYRISGKDPKALSIAEIKEIL